ncbi:hypothetical protein [Rhodopirellula bahusiensis]|uniref:hypothetical protein n=1 Tax=Rhodopirellula bahusiensis TaxID=2014065 RepID=UPI003265CA40
MNSICFSKGTAAQLVCAAAFLAFFGVGSEAAEGDPIAVRVWPGGTVTVQSHLGLSVAVQNDASTPEGSTPEGSTPEGDLPSNESEAGEIPKSSATISMGESGSYVLSRPANQAKATWKPVTGGNDSTDDEPQTPNDIRVNSLGGKAVHIQLDGVDLVIAGSDCTAQTLETISSIDAVIGSNLQRFASEGDKMLPAHVRNWISDSSSPVESVKTHDQDHNTVAVSMTTQDLKSDSTAVWWNISTQPW